LDCDALITNTALAINSDYVSLLYRLRNPDVGTLLVVDASG